MAAVLASGDGGGAEPSVGDGALGDLGIGSGGDRTSRCRGRSRSQRSIRRHFSMLPDDERDGRRRDPDHLRGPGRPRPRRGQRRGGGRERAQGDGIPRDLRPGLTAGAPRALSTASRHADRAAKRLERLRDDPGGRIRSDLEELFLPFLDAHQIPRPRLNAWLSIDERPLPGRLPLARRHDSSVSSTASSPTARSGPSARTASAIGDSGRAGTEWSASPKTNSWTEPRELAADLTYPHLQPSVITYAPRWP